MEKIKFTDKSHFRTFSREKLTSLTNRYKRDKVVQKSLLKMITQLRAKHILMYNPLMIEADIRNVITTCRRRKCKVYVPFMEGISFKMVEWRLPLYKKSFNIKEPRNSFAIKPTIDLAVVPVIGVDGALRRIGFGKGMYDRFFDTLEKKPPVLFVQREFCMTPMLLAEEHDIAADIYLTPYNIIIKRGKNGHRVTRRWWSRCSERRCRFYYREKNGSCKL